MIICEYCKTQLPGHSLFCCQCGGKVHLPDETLVSANFGPALRSALMQKNQATTHHAKQDSPHYAKLEDELRQMYRSGDFHKPILAEDYIHGQEKEDEDQDDTWI